MRITCCSILLALLTFTSCKKTETEEIIDLGYEFFPNEEGTYISYQVDSIGYGITTDTAHYQLKEVFAEAFVDATNQAAMKVERYKRLNDSQDWSLTDVWVQKRTSTSAIRTEENITYVRLAFPVNNGVSWNGNAYNTMDEWNYTFEDKDIPKTFNDITFQKTVRVNQRDNVNLVDQEIASEVYARGVGLVYKRLYDLNYQLGQVTGIDLEMTVIDYGDVVD